VDELRIVVDKALEKKLLSSENQRLRRELRSHSRDRTIIGSSAAIRRVSELITQVADSKANVLISGESGTGKEVVARAIHQRGVRCDKPFVAVSCAAIPETLLESELFGHVKGAFTGAIQNKKGLFEVADGGTLFLDEVGELTLAVQVKLLRAIQEKCFRRVGGSGDTRANVRIIAASNRRLDEEVAAGHFREDLYYRLNVIEIPLPPLRDRSEDIPLLIAHFIEKYATELENGVTHATDEVITRLIEYRFPGNVRELENVIERAVALSRSEVLDLDSLPPAVLSPAASGETPRITSSEGIDLETMLNDYERELLKEALQVAKGVKKRASKLVGVSFRSFRYRLEKLGLDHPSDGED
jgi:two-component system response regulator PilR (NtrC family)